MLVILKENVENLGRVGDVVRVTDGYARNFLIPRKLVATADGANVAAVEHQKAMLNKKRAAQKASAEELAAKLGAFTCKITRKVGEKDKLFGSVTAGDVTDALIAAGFEIEKRQVLMNDHFKALGTYSVGIKILPEVTATVKVTVAKEGA
jgi:large subunit ribosomal protein L9